MVKGRDPDLESSDSEDSKHRRNRLGRGAAIFMVLPVSPHAGSAGSQMSGWAHKRQHQCQGHSHHGGDIHCNKPAKGAADVLHSIRNRKQGASGWPCSRVSHMSMAWTCGRQLAA